jgi:hypothetical protein
MDVQGQGVGVRTTGPADIAHTKAEAPGRRLIGRDPDLATLIVALEGLTGKDPFRQGFRQFATAGELAALYAAA